LENFLNHYLVK